MNQEEFKRKLTAILSADVEGYSRLMGEDEDGTIRTLTTYRELMSTLIQKHRGRVVDSPGDNLLAEFGSVVDAVRCAVEIQEELRVRNAELPENRKMEFRIGINLGDVVEEGERIYGNGVNITARVEGLAEGGGICISGTVYDSVKNKLSLSYESLGEHIVKNIAEPVRVYRMRIGPEAAAPMVREEKKRPRPWRRAAIGAAAVVIIIAGALAIWNFYFRPIVEPASVERMAYPLPDKPSIAVLPFANIGGDPEQEDFSDGLTEEIITTLSKVSDLFVIASNSTFTYKGKPVKIKRVAEELGVRYVLEGSIRKGEDRVRVTAQLIDALTGHHLWAEGYDTELKDILAVQGEIAKKIITALEVKLAEGEQARVFAIGTDNVEAWALGVKAWKLSVKYTEENMAKARELSERAKKLDPKYSFPWVVQAQAHFVDARFQWTKSPPKSYKLALECAKQAIALNEKDPMAHGLLGTIYLLQRQHEKAIAEGERAIALNPNYADGYAILSQIMRYSGRFEEALALIEKGIRLFPNPRVFYPWNLSNTYVDLGRYEEALAIAKQLQERCLKGECHPSWGKTELIVSYMGLGREEEARAEVEEYLRLSPTRSLEYHRKTRPYKDPAHLERWISALRKAGLPESPPLPLPDKPSIAVLPFVNMSDDPKQEYFVDGMTDDLITDLSKISGLFVIARNSVFRYKGKPVDVKKVSRELGVRHVLEGSVRKVGNQVRINAQLIDASTGGHLWAERYDGKMDDVFALQDKITQKIVAALAVKLTSGEKEKVTRKETDNIAAYDAFLKGWGHYLRHTPEDFAKALSYFEKATELDPNYARAYASMALIYSRASKLGKVWQHALLVGSSVLADRQAKKYLDLAMKNPISTAYRVASFINVYDGRYEAAIADAERAVSLDPNDSGSHENMAFVLIMAGRPQEAIDFAKKAMRLDPHNLANPLYCLGLAHFCLKDFDEAANSLERALTYSPRHVAYLPALVAAYGHLGREKEAKATGQRYLDIIHQEIYSSKGGAFWKLMKKQDYIAHSGYDLFPPFKDAENRDLFKNGLLKAGLYEEQLEGN